MFYLMPAGYNLLLRDRVPLLIKLNPLGPIVPNVVIILSASSCDFRQCPWEICSVIAERAGQGKVGGCTRRVQTAWPCLGSVVERSWSAQGGPFPSFLA